MQKTPVDDFNQALEEMRQDWEKKLEEMRQDWEKKLEEMRQDWEKKFADLSSQAKISIDDFKKAFDAAADSAMKKFLTETEQVIETHSGDPNTSFKTTILLNESIKNEYPQKEPGADDLYWKTHQGQVTDALKARHDLLKEIIDTVGSTISGVFGGGKSS